MGKVGFFLKKPRGGRRSFAVVRYVDDQGKRRQTTVEDGRIDALNRAFLTGALTEERAGAEFKELISSLYKAEGVGQKAKARAGILDDNVKVFEKFWKEEYEGRELVDRRTAECEFLRALRYLGTTPLLGSSKADLAAALRKGSGSVTKRRRAVSPLNTILRYYGSTIRLSKPEEEIEEIRYITLEDLQTLLKVVENPIHRSLYATLFATGMRIGEAMALKPATPLTGRLFVDRQLKKDGTVKRPKRGKVGEIAYLRELEAHIKEWCLVENKNECRREASEALSKAAAKLWPKDPIKHITPHCLRHSHAIHLLSLGVPMGFVAQNLRHSEKVCQKYYSGFAHSSSSISALQILLSKTISE
jgi:integrase